jgi:hypothetical protein
MVAVRGSSRRQPPEAVVHLQFCAAIPVYANPIVNGHLQSMVRAVSLEKDGIQQKKIQD